MNYLTGWQGHRESIRGVSSSPDDARFVTCSDDQTIKLWDFQTKQEERTFTGTSAVLINVLSDRSLRLIRGMEQVTGGTLDALNGTLRKVY